MPFRSARNDSWPADTWTSLRNNNDDWQCLRLKIRLFSRTAVELLDSRRDRPNVNPLLSFANSEHLLSVRRAENRTPAARNVDQEKDERVLTVSQRTLAAERQVTANYLT